MSLDTLKGKGICPERYVVQHLEFIVYRPIQAYGIIYAFGHTLYSMLLLDEIQQAN